MFQVDFLRQGARHVAEQRAVAAHTLRLSAALLAAGRPHSVLPLSGVTHMTPQEEVAENLLHVPGGLPAQGTGCAQVHSYRNGILSHAVV